MKKDTHWRQNYLPRAGVVLVALVILFLGTVVCAAASRISDDNRVAKHVFPRVDGDAATLRVSDFYHQLTNNQISNPKVRRQLLGFYGTENLLFYDQYYQHGFDPITCSSMLPVSVTTSLLSTGPTAVIGVRAEYPDNTSATIRVVAVLRSDGLKIDSVTCPGDKGNLPPADR